MSAMVFVLIWAIVGGTATIYANSASTKCGCPCRIIDPDQTAVQTTEVRDGLDPAISLDRSKEWRVFT